MGEYNCCRRQDKEDERNLERNKLYTAIKKPNDFKNLDILILPEEPTTTKCNIINDNSIIGNNNNIYNNDENKEEQLE